MSQRWLPCRINWRVIYLLLCFAWIQCLVLVYTFEIRDKKDLVEHVVHQKITITGCPSAPKSCEKGCHLTYIFLRNLIEPQSKFSQKLSFHLWSLVETVHWPWLKMFRTKRKRDNSLGGTRSESPGQHDVLGGHILIPPWCDPAYPYTRGIIG